MRPYMYTGYPNRNVAAMPVDYRAQPLSYPPIAVPPRYRPGYPGMPSTQTYPYYPNGINPVKSNDANNEIMNGIISNNNSRDLIHEKGSKYKLSNIYRIQKTKPAIHKDDSSEDESKKKIPVTIPIVVTQQPIVAPVQRKASSSTSSSSSSSYSGCSTCSHCSTCSNCSCTECRTKENGVFYDDCPACRVDRERQQTKQQNCK
ncbi:unnamed protein product [Rotaria magnacalcarata]|uniref:Uncharacterized protein n=2 Tax=Rotaria magnacalcarata TaxID=392030 RepID=A0A816Q6M5_9BILA|nr:unnamed protein product [Rotaria magnacalcarata]CAF1679283.1 unnamed protein product [Rotaria magnacalcarata]CAF2056414.1 unnamed protein product [Rotaria magnacalcarata]CAF3872711.1 unnamed protein product [Rotaria magnacalcarata]CAF3962374.1 unnamed protein product [Rotaria magnacalcarata]